MRIEEKRDLSNAKMLRHYSFAYSHGETDESNFWGKHNSHFQGSLTKNTCEAAKISMRKRRRENVNDVT